MPVRTEARCTLARGLALLAATLFACAPAIDAQLDEAQSLVAEGRPMAALPLLENVVQRRPGDGPANLLLGQVLIQVGRTRAAFGPLERALESERWAVPAGLLLASAHLREGQSRDALSAVDRILATHPDQPAALRIRATAHLQLGEADAALADARHILEVDPDDAQAPILAGTALTRLGRLDEAEALLAGLEASARDAGSASRHASACVAMASFLEVGRRDSTRARVAWRECLERHPADPTVLQGASAFFDQHGDADASLAALRRALEHDPSALGVRLALAHRLAARGEPDEGERLLVEAAEGTGDTGAGAGLRASVAWRAVAGFRTRTGDGPGARDALERAIAVASPEESDALRFERAVLLVELGEIDAARAARDAIETPALAALLTGRLSLAEGDLESALGSLEASIRSDPGDARSHYWLGVAAQGLGRVDRALEAWGRSHDLDPAATDAALAAARLAHALGNHNGAIELLRRHRNTRGTAPRETTLIEARVIAALGQEEVAVALLESLLERRPDDAEALALLSDVLQRSQGPEAARARIERARAAGLDLAASEALPLLRAWGLLSVAAGRTREALARIDEAIGERPGSVALLVVKASVQAAAGDSEGAEATLRAALARAPDDAAALANLGAWLHGHGRDNDEALPLLLRAHEAAPGDVESAHLAARILAARGESARAEALLRTALASNPLDAGVANDLAWLLASEGRDLELALELARRAARLAPSGATLDTLGWVRLARGENEAARESLSQALARDPENPGFRYRLGLALARSGRPAEAREAFREALAAGPFPEADLARAELARSDG